MYKLKTNSGIVVKSFDILELYEFIIESNESEYQFFIGYKPISYIDFCKLFFSELNDTEMYIKLECKLYITKTLVEHINN